MSDATHNQPRLFPSPRLVSACLLFVVLALILPLRPAVSLHTARVQPQLLQLASSQPLSPVRVIASSPCAATSSSAITVSVPVVCNPYRPCGNVHRIDDARKSNEVRRTNG